MRADMYIDMCLGLQVAGSAPVLAPRYMHAYVSAHMSTRMRQAPRCVGVVCMADYALGLRPRPNTPDTHRMISIHTSAFLTSGLCLQGRRNC